MDVTLNIDELLEKRTIFKQKVNAESRKTIISMILGFLTMFSIALVYGYLAGDDIIAWNNIPSFLVILLIMIVMYSGSVRASMYVRFYEDELGLTDQRTKI